MSGWLYIIKNGDLYKIGITGNFAKRMRQLKPDYIIAKLHTNYFKKLERDLHKKYNDFRLPQTEYFRLDDYHLGEIKDILSNFYYPNSINIRLFIRLIFLISLISLFVLFVNYLRINDINNVISSSLFLMGRITIGLSFLSLFLQSGQYFNIFNEIKYRSIRFFILLFFSLLFRIPMRYLF